MEGLSIASRLFHADIRSYVPFRESCFQEPIAGSVREWWAHCCKARKSCAGCQEGSSFQSCRTPIETSVPNLKTMELYCIPFEVVPDQVGLTGPLRSGKPVTDEGSVDDRKDSDCAE
jgi:hypothetical protein